jgi:hypothetical protein
VAELALRLTNPISIGSPWCEGIVGEGGCEFNEI